MKKVLIAVLALSLLLAGFVAYTFSTTGFFRKLENKMPGELLQKVSIPGAEDITISHEDAFALISSDDRASRRDGNPVQGGLYYLDLRSPDAAPQLISGNFSKPFFPHGISMIRLDSAHHKVYVVNHVNERHSLEVFHLYADSLVFSETLTHPSMLSPNDLVAIDDTRFYFTNDHGYTSGWKKFMEEQLGLAVSNVVYFDGKEYREVADGIAYANGINYDPGRKLLFVASPRHFLVKVYQVEATGSLQFIEDIPCGTGVDNIEFDEDGKIWIGCHPNLLGFAAYAADKKEQAPSEIITIDYREQGDYAIESTFVDDGAMMSAATVAAVFRDRILVGNVMDDHFLILSR